MDIKGSEGWAALVYVMGSSSIVGYDTKTISDSKSIADGSYCGLQSARQSTTFANTH